MMRVFVTVGGLAPFDSLVKAVDSLIGNSPILPLHTAQIGRGAYIPDNMNYYKFCQSLEHDLRKADLVISHTGASTLIECARMGKPTIAVPNPSVVDNHEIARYLASEGYLLFATLDRLDPAMIAAESFTPKVLCKPCSIPELIRSHLGAT